jgi:hypothetical protein
MQEPSSPPLIELSIVRETLGVSSQGGWYTEQKAVEKLRELNSGSAAFVTSRERYRNWRDNFLPQDWFYMISFSSDVPCTALSTSLGEYSRINNFLNRNTDVINKLLSSVSSSKPLPASFLTSGRSFMEDVDASSDVVLSMIGYAGLTNRETSLVSADSAVAMLLGAPITMEGVNRLQLIIHELVVSDKVMFTMPKLRRALPSTPQRLGLARSRSIDSHSDSSSSPPKKKRAAGGGLRQSKLTHNHFWGLDSHYKMKVSPAAQVFSASMRRIIAQLCGDDDDLLTRYAGVDQLCEEMDVYIDIMNSTSESSSKQKKQGLHHQSVSKESGACQERLLGVLRFFTSWKESTDNPDQFIPQQSYEDLCWSINGNVSLVEYYTHMFPTFKWRLKCVSTDCCENHFANTRYFSGSGANATAVNCLKASETGNGISSGKGVGLQLQFAKSNNGGT